jgi:hypothetical protein
LSACPKFSDRPDLKNRGHRDGLEITELSFIATHLIQQVRRKIELGRDAKQRGDYDKSARF